MIIFIHWENKLSIGNDLIDTEHRMMMLLCRKLDFAIKNDGSERTLMSIVRELKAFAQYHFISEENVMHEVGFPGTIQHSKIHSRLLGNLDEMTERHHLLERLSVFVGSGLSSVSSICEERRWSAYSQLSLIRHSGERHRRKVVDISLHGVALETSTSIPEGENVFVGKMFGRVVRGPSDQVTVQFLRYRSGPPAARLLA